MTDLVDKGLIQEVGSADAQIDDMETSCDGVIEGIQEPRGHGHLRVGEDAEDVEFGAWSQSGWRTLVAVFEGVVDSVVGECGRGGDDTGDKGAMTMTVQGQWVVVLRETKKKWPTNYNTT